MVNVLRKRHDTTEATAVAIPTVKPQAPLLPWHPFLAVIIALATYFGAAIVGQIVVSAYPLLKNYSQSQAEAYINGTFVQFLYVLIVEIVTILCMYLFIRRYKIGFGRLGLVRPRLRDAGVALLAIPAYIAGYGVLLGLATLLFPSINIDQEQQLGFANQQSPLGLVLTFMALVVLPPLAEEIVVRGFLFTSLRKSFRLWQAIIVTSVIFAAAHLQIGSGAPLLWVAAIDTFVLSLVLCFLRYKTGSLWPGICLHALKNCVAFLALFVFHLG